MPHWTTPYLGLPYALGGQGPDAWDCWAFFRLVQGQAFGRALPAIPSPETFTGVAKALRDGIGPSGWVQADEPANGDGVLLSRLRYPAHVGVWVGDLAAILHCGPGGSTLADRFHLRAARWQVHGYYRPEA